MFGNQKYLEETNIQLSQAIDSLNFRLSRQSQNEDPERSDDNDTKLQECIKISSLLCRNSREKSQAL